MKRKAFRTITISRSATRDQVILAALRVFHIYDDPSRYIITDCYGELSFAYLFENKNKND